VNRAYEDLLRSSLSRSGSRPNEHDPWYARTEADRDRTDFRGSADSV
jgi:hypothetical protein